VLTEVVEQVDVVAGHLRLQAGAHLTGKHLVPQALRRPDLVLVAGPSHLKAADRALRSLSAVAACISRMK
jgi:hypothetical protein